MDPITIVTLASKIAESTGLSGWIGRKLGGDKGEEIANKVTETAQIVTGAKTPEKALEMIQADAALKDALRQKLIDNSHELEKLAFADVANARHMQEVALAQVDVFAKRFVYYFAIAWSLFAMIYLLCITFVELPASSQRYADTVLGFLLGTIIATIIGFFYGTSHSSKGKDSTITQLTDAVKSITKK